MVLNVSLVEMIGWALCGGVWTTFARRRARGQLVASYLLQVAFFPRYQWWWPQPRRIPTLQDQVLLLLAMALVVWSATIAHRLIYGP